jgi:2-desacetyl-2-hydroxyethyl bacteriochlorophyllide A dehydrogenase
MDSIRYLSFIAPYQVEVVSQPAPNPQPGQIVVRTLLSAISPGSEMLIYRGQFPSELPVDETLPALSGSFRYPLRYGYSAVGEVIEIGESVDPAWLGKRVFAFQPHGSHYLASPDEVQVLPAGIDLEDAVFLPNMETAVNFLMDGAPLIGEDVVVFGQGIVGLLTSALLMQYPLNQLITLDRYPRRREASIALGVSHCLDPLEQEFTQVMANFLPGGADLAYEISGAPEALDLAISVTGFAGRIVIGSWYGQKRASLNLGGHFHRSRIRLISSQVSTISPEISGRWNKPRRFNLAWEMLRECEPSRWVTHRFPIEQAPAAYQLLQEHPEDAIQVLFTYS